MPFEREIHPSYLPNNIKSFQQIKNSITSHRGCFGGCNFFAIGLHQGKTIRSHGKGSIKNEIKTLAEKKYFKGTISDVGGPTANMYGMYCKIDISDKCKRNSCLYPKICKYLEYSHTEYKALLWEVFQSQNVKNVFIGSGIRFDLALKDREFIKQVAENQTSGLLKLAPEHISEEVLEKMNKPSFSYYRNFVDLFIEFSKKAGKKQFTVPYVIVGHPGEELKHTIEMAFFLKKIILN
ncbi:MAG: radical SAM protein [Candidatus Cloacimonadota bacterium]|nr:radical SAM protein [Candidatus Cloacimonadota bacterium]